MDMEDIGGGGSGERREMVTPQLRAALTKQGYKILGSHSGVKLCRWTKAQLRGRGGCYKHSFYGIESHRCMEATPSLACANQCVVCWRHHSHPVGREWRWQMDDAETLVTSAISEPKGMIKQMKGVPGVLPSGWRRGWTRDTARCRWWRAHHVPRDRQVRLPAAREANKHVPGHERAVPRRHHQLTGHHAAVRLRGRGHAGRRSRLSTDRCSGITGYVNLASVFFFVFPIRRRQTRTPGASLSNSDCSFDGLSTAARCRHERRLKIPHGNVRFPHGIIGDHTYRVSATPGVFFFFRDASRDAAAARLRARQSLTSHVSRFLFPRVHAQDRFVRSLTALRDKNQRTVYRLTLVAGWNASDAAEYAKLIDLGKPDLIEIKGMTYCGATSGASNLTMKNVPHHEDVKKFGEALCTARLDLVSGRDAASTST